MKYIMLSTILLLLGLSFIAINNHSTSIKPIVNKATPKANLVIMKDVGEAYMDYFGLSEEDFQILRESGINTIEGNFDICAYDEDVRYFLDQSHKHNLKVIMPAGSGEAEWGYECDQEGYPLTQKPSWEKDKVIKWINKWKSHPAIYAWDTSNEAGSVFPNSSKFMLEEDQLKEAYRDVKGADPRKPVMIRMNGWFFYDNDENFFRPGNPFASKVADIVMINAYSNVEDYYDDFVSTVLKRSTKSINQIDSNVNIVVALGIWEEEPLWKKPKTKQLINDWNSARKNTELVGIGYFKYGAKGSEWYLPDPSNGAPELLATISNL